MYVKNYVEYLFLINFITYLNSFLSKNMNAPLINESTKEERLAYIIDKYKCQANCDMCGNCKLLRGHSEEDVFAEYIDGIKEYTEIASHLWK